jgi:SAM-dependent methyltransferase
MSIAPRFAALFALAYLSSIATTASAQTREACEREFAPRSGQAGKDVIWVPTQEELVLAMLKAAKVTAKDYVVDLGSGDGRIPIVAAKEFGARATGIEYNPQMVKLAQCNARAEGVTDKIEIKQGDIFETDFRDATVVTMYLLSDLNMKLRPTILAMKPGTRVVSNSFKMGDWSPDQHIEPENGYTRAYLWIVPAQAAGRWTVKDEAGAERFELRIEQDYQELDATILGQSGLTVKSAALHGADIEFILNDEKQRERTLKGQVDGGSMRLSGELNGKPAKLIATRQ